MEFLLQDTRQQLTASSIVFSGIQSHLQELHRMVWNSAGDRKLDHTCNCQFLAEMNTV